MKVTPARALQSTPVNNVRPGPITRTYVNRVLRSGTDSSEYKDTDCKTIEVNSERNESAQCN